MKYKILLLLLQTFSIVATSQKRADKSNNHTGYKGFIKKGYYLLPQDWFSTAIEITTSHGYQLSPMFYTGLGTGAGVSYGYNRNLYVPIFANLRVTPLNKRHAPFGNIKTGVYLGFTNGLFLSTIAGYRLEMDKRGGFNTGFGYRIIAVR